ncbi:MAG TPA: hypothetical protein VE693_07590 [Gaiellaceae bacterium]|jgi:hypothetical protein|nr:hypothetical protein [Gaiellaceae bacterium]
MPLRIRVRSGAVADELCSFLDELGADVRKEGTTVVLVRRHPPIFGEPPEQDRMELEFVLRVWASQRARPADFEIDEAA